MAPEIEGRRSQPHSWRKCSAALSPDVLGWREEANHGHGDPCPGARPIGRGGSVSTSSVASSSRRGSLPTPAVERGMRVVDLGAGTGVLTAALAARAAAVLAVEIDPVLAAAAGPEVRPARRTSPCSAPTPATWRCRSIRTGSWPTRPSATPRRSCAACSTTPPGGCCEPTWSSSGRSPATGRAISAGAPADLLGADLGSLVAVRPRAPPPGGLLPSPPRGRRRGPGDHPARQAPAGPGRLRALPRPS